MLKVLYFASLREQLGVNEQQLEFKAGENLHALVERLFAGAKEHKAIVLNDSVNCALNQKLVTLDAELSDGDEIAFFPPVTGG